MSILANFERFDKDGVELIIDTATGESFASVNGYARMSGVSKQAVSRRLKTVNLEGLKVAEILTASGLKTVNLIPESIIVQWLPKDNPVMATQIMQLGVRVFMHKLAGFEVTTTAVSHAPIPDRQLPPVRDGVDYANAAIALNLFGGRPVPIYSNKLRVHYGRKQLATVFIKQAFRSLFRRKCVETV